jgi:protein translocase SecG subunit
VLLQKGKGVGFAGAFGVGGGSEAIFGPRSSKSLPQKITYGAALLFMFLAVIMSMLSGRVGKSAAPSLVDENAKQQQSLQGLFEGEAAAKEGETAPAAATTEGEAATAPAGATPATPAAPAPAEAAPAAPAETAPAAAPAPAPAAPAEQHPTEPAPATPAQ